ncbi:hypothetical protein FH063_001038 [Azospirillum argentinense]|uniref:Uncharacterized protein n=1 Tax=Azospirillum argentinense TaxID=2970906 RepID=A0A5B0L574_9PROT|nr:hypothetical protein FH063_001038 [Azospirillum argentinense]
MQGFGGKPGRGTPIQGKNPMHTAARNDPMVCGNIPDRVWPAAGTAGG